MRHLLKSLPQTLLVFLAALLVVAAVGSAQGFDQPGSFGESDASRDFQVVQETGAENRYFIHDQAVKLAVVGGLSLLAVTLLTLRGFRYRKWFLLLSLSLVGLYLGGVLCPLSSVQNIVLKWNTGYLLLFLVPVVLALVLGRVFCGYVCPFGALQELLHVRRWALRIPGKWRKLLRATKYVLLIYLVARVIVTGTLALQGYTPFKTLFTWGGTPATIAISAVAAVLSVFLWRPFCEFFCPLGALLSLLSRVSLFRLETQANCVTCGKCTSRCPVDACDGGDIRSSDCYLCGECVRACPVTSLRLAPRWHLGKSMKRDRDRELEL